MSKISPEEIQERINRHQQQAQTKWAEMASVARRIEKYLNTYRRKGSPPEGGFAELVTAEDEAYALQSLSKGLFSVYNAARAAEVILTSEKLSEEGMRRILRTSNATSEEVYLGIIRHPNASRVTVALAYHQYATRWAFQSPVGGRIAAEPRLGKYLMLLTDALTASNRSVSTKDIAEFLERSIDEPDDVLETAAQFIKDRQKASREPLGLSAFYEAMRLARRV